MKKLLLALLIVSCVPSFGATWLMRSSATSGLDNGLDWDNAFKTWTSLFAVLSRGDVVYVATATYDEPTFMIPVSGTTLITIYKATPTDHWTEVGWNSAYGVGQATYQWSSLGYVVGFITGYWRFDGAYCTQRSAGSYGFRIYIGTRARTSGEIYLINCGENNVPGISLKNIEIDFNNGSVMNDTGMSYCLYTGGNHSNWLLQDIYAHHSPGGGFTMRDGPSGPGYAGVISSSNVTFRRVIWENFGGGGGGTFHWEIAWLSNIDTLLIEDCTIHNVFKCSTGIDPSCWLMVGMVRNFTYRNNRHWYTTGATQNGQGPGQGNGVLTTFADHQLTCTNVFIINNGWFNMQGMFVSIGMNYDTVGGDNFLFENNMVTGASQLRFPAGTGNTRNPWTVRYNYYDTPLYPCFQCVSDPNVDNTLTTAKFVNYAGEDFHLASATPAGDATAGASYAPYDPDGRIRGSDGNWDRGPFEFGPLPVTTASFARSFGRAR